MENTGLIARRYLFSRKHISLISTLTFISIIGVTIGTALLILILSVFNGFFDVVQGYLLSYDPDIRIESMEGTVFSNFEDKRASLSTIPEIELISPYVNGKALLANNEDQNKVIELKGVEKDSFLKLIDIDNSIVSGVFDVSVRNRKPGLVIHESLRNELGLSLGDEVALLSASGMRKTLTQVTAPRVYRFEVRGSYSLEQIGGGAEVFIDLTAAQRLFRARNNISGFDVKLDNFKNAESLKPEITQAIGPGFKASS